MNYTLKQPPKESVATSAEANGLSMISRSSLNPSSERARP